MDLDELIKTTLQNGGPTAVMGILLWLLHRYGWQFIAWIKPHAETILTNFAALPGQVTAKIDEQAVKFEEQKALHEKTHRLVEAVDLKVSKICDNVINDQRASGGR